MNVGRIDQALKGLGPKRVALICVIIMGPLWFLYYLPGDDAAGRMPGSGGNAGRVSLSADEADRESRPPVSDPRSRSQADPAAAAALEQRIIGSRNLSAKRAMDEAQASLVKLEAAAAEWESLAGTLQTDQRGRALAADADILPALIELLDVGKEQAGEAAAYREQLDRISGDLDSFLGENGVTEVTASTRQAIETLRDEIRDRERAMQGSLSQLKAWADRGKKGEAGTESLADAIRAFESRQAEQAVQDRIAARNEAREEARVKMLEAEKEKAEAENRLKATELAAETERLRAQEEMAAIAAAQEASAQEAKLAREKLEAEFTQDLPEIKSLLSPFVTPAPYKLYPHARYLYSGENTGVSLKVIAHWGALEPTDDGLDKMSMLGNTEFRPLGTFPKYVKSEWRRSADVKQRLVRAQELLLKYGDLLIEKGMLEK